MTRTLGRMFLLSAAAVVLLHGRAGAGEDSAPARGGARDESAPAPVRADEEGPLGRILEFQSKLSERIDYELPVATTLDTVLNELLTKRGIPWSANRDAFVAAGQDKDVIKKTEVGPIERLTGVTRGSLLKKLLSKIPADGGKGAPTFILRRDHIEITTVGARMSEFGDAPLPAGDDGALLPLAYAAFEDVPLQDALKQLARDTETVIVLDARAAGKTKVTAELPGVPLDAAIRLLADMADLKCVRVANVLYVTSAENAARLQEEEDGRRQGDAGDTPVGRARAMQKQLNQRIDYELLVQTTLDKALDELLTRQGLPWTVNEPALARAGLDKDCIGKIEISKIEKMTGVTRATVFRRLLAAAAPDPDKAGEEIDLLARLRRLLAAAPDPDKAELTYVLRPSGLEITTRRAFLDEFYPGRDEAVPPPLAYDVFKKVPLREALAELVETTGGNVVLDPRATEEGAAKVTAEFTAVPLDTAVQVLAEEAGLKLMRLGNVYYVTTPERARPLRKEDQERRLEQEKRKADSTKPPANP